MEKRYRELSCLTSSSRALRHGGQHSANFLASRKVCSTNLKRFVYDAALSEKWLNQTQKSPINSKIHFYIDSILVSDGIKIRHHADLTNWISVSSTQEEEISFFLKSSMSFQSSNVAAIKTSGKKRSIRLRGNMSTCIWMKKCAITWLHVVPLFSNFKWTEAEPSKTSKVKNKVLWLPRVKTQRI